MSNNRITPYEELDSSARFPRRLAGNSSEDVVFASRSIDGSRSGSQVKAIHTVNQKDLGLGYGSGDLDNSSAIDLKRLFPVSRRLVIKAMLPWLVGFGLPILIYILNFRRSVASEVEPAFSNNAAVSGTSLYAGGYLLIVSGIVMLMVIWVYYELQRYFFQYRIEGFRIILRKGILLRDEGSLPLLPIAEVFSRRGVLDVLLGLYQVHVAVPVDSVKSFARIDGLNSQNATSLIDFLSAQLSRQVTVSQPRILQSST